LSTAEWRAPRAATSSAKCAVTARSAAVLPTPYASPRDIVDQSFQSRSVKTWSSGRSELWIAAHEPFVGSGPFSNDHLFPFVNARPRLQLQTNVPGRIDEYQIKSWLLGLGP
jgi:hypothetical protein